MSEVGTKHCPTAFQNSSGSFLVLRLMLHLSGTYRDWALLKCDHDLTLAGHRWVSAKHLGATAPKLYNHRIDGSPTKGRGANQIF